MPQMGDPGGFLIDAAEHGHIAFFIPVAVDGEPALGWLTVPAAALRGALREEHFERMCAYIGGFRALREMVVQRGGGDVEVLC